jgi:hypothetical protein
MSKKKNTPHQKLKPASNPLSPQTAAPKTARTTVTASAKSTFWQSHKISVAILSLFAFALYAPSIAYDYALDDSLVITGNQFVQKGFAGIGDIFNYESFRGYFGAQTTYLEGDRYRPLSIATFAMEVGLFGTGKAGLGHFLNVVFYMLTAVLIYRVLLFMFPNGRHTALQSGLTENTVQAKDWKKQILTIPFLATALFLAHPLHVEVVANIKGRDEILCLLGELGALYFTFKYTAKPKPLYLVGSFLAFTIAVFSKESALPFLAIVPLTAHFFTQASTADKVKMTMPILAGTLVYLAARFHAIGYLLDTKVVTDLMNNPFYGMSWGDKMATIFYTFLLYFKLHIFPHPLTHDYYPFHIAKMTWRDWQPILSLLLNLGLGVMILRGWRSRSVWAYSAAFYLLALSIVSNIVVSVGIFMNERFAYHASLGFCIALAYWLVSLLSKNKEAISGNAQNTERVVETTQTPSEAGASQNAVFRLLGIALSALFILGFTLKTWLREPDWRNGHALNKSALIHSPNSARANCFYGIMLWESEYIKLPADDINHSRRRPLLDSMRYYFDRSLAILPDYTSAAKMWSGIAAEYHKIDGDLDKFLAQIERIKFGGYDKFQIDYLRYVNNRTQTRADADKLIAFYQRQIAYFQNRFGDSQVTQEYQKLLSELQGRGWHNQ